MAVEVGDITIEIGDHVVQFYEVDAELVETVAPYLVAAARAGEVAVVVATEDHRVAFEAEMAAAGIDVAQARRSGNYVAVDAADMMSQFVDDGRLDPARFDRVIGGLIRQAAGIGRPVRAYGEMVALLWDAGYVMAAIELEGLWNELGRRLAFSLFCAYPSQSVSGSEHADALREVCDHHSGIVRVLPGGEADGADRLTHRAEEARRFSARVDEPRAARRFVVDALRRWGCDDARVADAELVLSELATNAVVHALSPFTVAVSLEPDSLRIAVHDSSPSLPAPGLVSPTTQSGRGLELVAAVASRWGVEHTLDGKVVWADLSR